MSPRRTGAGLVAVLLLAVLAAACTSSGAAPPVPAPAPTPTGRYVALGDSYTAGPLIPTTDLAGGCARSDHNYPSMVADELDVAELVDVSCSGARTLDLTGFQHPFQGSRVPPQLRAVTPDTTLVTLGIGGNDLHLFTTLIHTCTQLRPTDPGGAPCARELARNGPDLDAAVDTISRRVVRVLRLVEARAPRARVLLVGYLRLVPDEGTCVSLPMAAGDYAEGRRIGRALDRALHRAARRAGVAFVDMYAASLGHDICSSDPWVNGSVTDRQRALAYHPFAAGMRATAREVVATLDSP
jgi:lysophospholipase L1-like esterase